MNFNKAQLGAIEHKDGAMLVLAGPGSGKTAVITHRTKNLITKHHVKPSEILVITFTKAAANEMKERFNSLMKDERVNVSFGTFHAVFFTILKYAYRFTSANIADESVRYGFIREILSYYRLEYKDENEFIGNLLAEISLTFPYTLSARAFSTLSILPHRGRMAWNRESRPWVAEPPAESPSTM